MSYKELQQVAKELGIKANQKKEVLIQMILEKHNAVSVEVLEIDEEMPPEDVIVIDALEESNDVMVENTALTNVTMDESKDKNADIEEPVFNVKMTAAQIHAILELDVDSSSVLGELQQTLRNTNFDVCAEERASEASAQSPAQSPNEASSSAIKKEKTDDTKSSYRPQGAANEVSGPSVRFEFVRSDNTIVEFKQNGVRVIAGWSKKDFKFHLYSDNKGDRLTSAQFVINVFKKYTNGVHGDVARIVYALTRLRQKPSVIRAKEEWVRSQRGMLVEPNKENVSATKPVRRNAFVPIDPEWLKDYRERMGEHYDARKVRADYEAYLKEAGGHVAGKRGADASA